MPGRYLLYTDGASRGNPGRAAIGAVLYREDEDDRQEVGRVAESIGRTTNNVAEYRAVIAGLQMAERHRPDELVVRCDSELLVRQLSGQYKVKSEGLKPLYQQVRSLVGRFPSIRFQHVRREENRVADALANQALDS